MNNRFLLSFVFLLVTSSVFAKKTTAEDNQKDDDKGPYNLIAKILRYPGKQATRLSVKKVVEGLYAGRIRDVPGLKTFFHHDGTLYSKWNQIAVSAILAAATVFGVYKKRDKIAEAAKKVKRKLGLGKDDNDVHKKVGEWKEEAA